MPSLCGTLLRYGQLDKAGRKSLLAATFIFEAMAILRVSAGDEELDLLDLAEEERLNWDAKGALSPAPLLTGADLLKAGFPPGPALGATLEKIRRAQLNEEVATRESALDWLRLHKT